MGDLLSLVECTGHEPRAKPLELRRWKGAVGITANAVGTTSLRDARQYISLLHSVKVYEVFPLVGYQ